MVLAARIRKKIHLENFTKVMLITKRKTLTLAKRRYF